MKKFKLGQRVLVRSASGNNEPDVTFHTPEPGRVVRMRRCDDWAWVELDSVSEPSCHPFPSDDPRWRHVLTGPEYCDEITP